VSKHKQGWELYNIDDDRTELRDLAAAQPERVRTMAAQWQAWGDRVGVMPWGFEIPEGSGASPTGKKEKAAKNP
jgi:arylsulfatase